MPAMTKKVNIKTTIPIRNIKPPIYGSYMGIVMSTGDILKCLCKRAFVEEILPDGSTVRLNMKNYYTDNGAGLDASKNVKIEEPRIETVDAAEVADEVLSEPEVAEIHEEVTEDVIDAQPAFISTDDNPVVNTLADEEPVHVVEDLMKNPEKITDTEPAFITEEPKAESVSNKPSNNTSKKKSSKKK